MNTRNFFVSGLILAGLTMAVHAQPVIPTNSDVVIGFTASGGTGAATNIELDVGSASNYIGLASGTYTIGNFNTSLTNIYGSGWGSRSDLSWGAVGATGGVSSNVSGAPVKTIWASSVETGSSYPAPAWTESQSYKYTQPNTNIGGMYNGFANGTSLTETGQTTAIGGTVNAIQIGTATGGSWSAAGAGTLFGMSAFASGVTFQGAVSGPNLDLYQNSPIASGSAPASDLGYFALNGNTGALTFTVPGSAIPEPSTYAMILGLAALGFVMIRRRQALV